MPSVNAIKNPASKIRFADPNTVLAAALAAAAGAVADFGEGVPFTIPFSIALLSLLPISGVLSSTVRGSVVIGLRVPNGLLF